MKPYSEYTAEELAMEKLFIRWIRFPDDPSINAFWEGWQRKNPDMQATIHTARSLVLRAADPRIDSISQQDAHTLWGRIKSTLENRTERESAQPSHIVPSSRIGWEGILIAIVLAILFLILTYTLFV
ncbi:hypothetical protein CLV98_104190 [Dyadobacter jejuensis]|uniref:Uncharacterized protein n=1 Tax=Dyadobacter jejuensis TaxID=1082580 RepID=A0A316ALA6_9BACT|nr:hypothetical protein [Dyadobacter jejuensis]PWJ58331.1 hypothetical protein CLV98_104190 [Dyadobacter jejuensis]